MEEKPLATAVRRNERIPYGFVTATTEKSKISGYGKENTGFTWKCVQLHHLIGIKFLGKSFTFLSLSFLIFEMGDDITTYLAKSM